VAARLVVQAPTLFAGASVALWVAGARRIAVLETDRVTTFAACVASLAAVVEAGAG
jgi:hypothetical protein